MTGLRPLCTGEYRAGHPAALWDICVQYTSKRHAPQVIQRFGSTTTAGARAPGNQVMADHPVGPRYWKLLAERAVAIGPRRLCCQGSDARAGQIGNYIREATDRFNGAPHGKPVAVGHQRGSGA
jgi:hypothetical protein